MGHYWILFGFVFLSLVASAQTSTDKVKKAPLDAGDSRDFSASLETIVQYAKGALNDVNLELEFIEQVDNNSYMLMGIRRASGFSWGEILRLVVTRKSATETTVYVYAKKKVGMNLTAKTTKPSTIFSSIQSQLALAGDKPLTITSGNTVEKKSEPVQAAVVVPVAVNNSSQKRTALVIGNAQYSKAPLRNPVNDALAISKQLKLMGFEVFTYTNAGQAEMKSAIRKFGDALNKNSGVGLFYYAGHGVQSNGKNYLIPVDANIEREYDIEDQGVDSGLVLRMMELYKNPLNIIVLDACRNNPYSRGFRSVEEGLAPVYVAPTGSIISFATAPGRTASDGDGENGLYTQELIKAMQQPNKNLEEVFKAVRINVAKLSNSEQIPWTNSSLMGEFYFIKK
ncbi:MAG: hypothetical protein DRI71_09425 [Bacteroidetes bacterium]|nr:MAG: hypothetical protein DRI71_09425 [Bacteroidota bacterium]